MYKQPMIWKGTGVTHILNSLYKWIFPFKHHKKQLVTSWFSSLVNIVNHASLEREIKTCRLLPSVVWWVVCTTEKACKKEKRADSFRDSAFLYLENEVTKIGKGQVLPPVSCSYSFSVSHLVKHCNTISTLVFRAFIMSHRFSLSRGEITFTVFIYLE